MKRAFFCASCIKQYVQPSYGSRGTPVFARMCLYCAKKYFYTKVLEQERKNFYEQKVGMLLYIHTFNLCKVQSMDDNCGEWVECMGVASACGEQEAGVASGSGWNLWVWLLGVLVRRYIILLIPTPRSFFAAASLLFVHIYMFRAF